LLCIQGYDVEEIPTGRFKGYCVELPYEQSSGLCIGYKGNPKVCAVSQDGTGNPSAALQWYDNEVFNRRAPHTDKTMTKGSQAFNVLQITLNSWVCKQLGETVRVRSNIDDNAKQESACNYIWRRDQEVQASSASTGVVPTEGGRWVAFTYADVC
jgi:hypothetical protein